jgi:NAD(P)-dependent dehydrogenase (short-subunit alcohol dehydrogenase family)
VVVADLNEKDCKEIANTLGEKHLGIVLNVTNADSIKTAKEVILEKYGSIDVLVNNAAINDMFENPLLGAKQSMFEHYPIDMFTISLDVNVTGMFLCSQILGSVMAEQKSGSIINIASTYGIVAPDQTLYQNENGEQVFYKSPAYPVTKSAVIGFTKYLAAYWGNKNVRVNSLSPGGVENNQDEFFQQKYAAKTLLGRMAATDDYQGAIVFLASDASAYMTGANLVVDGGFTTI